MHGADGISCESSALHSLVNFRKFMDLVHVLQCGECPHREEILRTNCKAARRVKVSNNRSALDWVTSRKVR